MVSEYCNARHIIMGRHSRHRRNGHRHNVYTFSSYFNICAIASVCTAVIDTSQMSVVYEQKCQYQCINYKLIFVGNGN